jgi:sec-independent protein translocase protein TatA
MGSMGWTELLIVAMIALLLFGNKVPSVMRSLGRGVTEFKKGVQGVQDDIEKAGKTPPAKEDGHEVSDKTQTP